MNTTELRKQAENLTHNRQQAVADAEGMEREQARMIAEGTHGQRDIDYLGTMIERADNLANMLAETEAHAWAAYDQAVQQEHYEYLAEQDNA